MNLHDDLEAIQEDTYGSPLAMAWSAATQERVDVAQLERDLRESITRSVLLGFTSGALFGAGLTVVAILMVRL